MNVVINAGLLSLVIGTSVYRSHRINLACIDPVRRVRRWPYCRKDKSPLLRGSHPSGCPRMLRTTCWCRRLDLNDVREGYGSVAFRQAFKECYAIVRP